MKLQFVPTMVLLGVCALPGCKNAADEAEPAPTATAPVTSSDSRACSDRTKTAFRASVTAGDEAMTLAAPREALPHPGHVRLVALDGHLEAARHGRDGDVVRRRPEPSGHDDQVARDDPLLVELGTIEIAHEPRQGGAVNVRVDEAHPAAGTGEQSRFYIPNTNPGLLVLVVAASRYGARNAGDRVAELGTPTDRAVNDVRNAVAQIRGTLPDGILEPQITRVDAENEPISYVGAQTTDMTLEQLSWYVDNVVSRRLLTVDGMAAVETTERMSW